MLVDAETGHHPLPDRKGDRRPEEEGGSAETLPAREGFPTRCSGGCASSPSIRASGIQLDVGRTQRGDARDSLGARRQREGHPHPGPVGEYVEVIDHDPASGAFYAAVDLNDNAIVAQDGLPPSESNPQFHQQMVYAVTMRTIRNFERALGRLALWSPHRDKCDGNASPRSTCRGCASIRTRCARRTRTTARRRRRSSSATSPRRSERTEPARRR